ncbi:ECF transporter S component [Tepidimicrobium xylanilyticum]|uniref:Riboflavin transporter n=1 Tax=Tepidimicrobium xylanilyticum TaxID=1123352 RepID=A0A1H2QEM7_9FIRM|nr:ECF transporter S component [Tepidimicrobium xylanilyticum]GMG95674.1 riboflavin transporter [Tepidimicrobium xylanilyticum]SDW05707.1 Riboflavin transporter FmnP [Tepidimicrobium xylanilyticum]
MYTLNKELLNTKTMVKISVLAVIALILMLLDFPLWFAPSFLKFDISDVPALIGSFALGPMAGVLVQLVKNLLNLLIEGSSTGGVGELANFVVGSIYVYTAGLFYYKDKTFKNAIIGMSIGVLVMTAAMSTINYYIMIPFYAKLFGLPIDKIVAMGSAVNKYVVDYKSLILYAIVPFNLFKGIIVTLVTLLIYKRVSPILKK